MYRIPCPKCAKTLKFKDPKHLGQKIKCPNCKHPFVLALPGDPEDEVEMELVQPPASPAPPQTPEPLTGTSARWVPDDPNAQPVPVQPAAIETPTVVPQFDTAVSHAVPAVSAPAVPLVVAAADQTTSPISEIRKRNRKRGKTGWILGLLGLVLATGIGGAAFVLQKAEAPLEKKKLAKNAAWETEKLELEASAAAAKDVSPTTGEPIDLKYLPPGANIIVHLRPSEIWSEADSRRELLFALGPLGKWLETKVRELSQFEPAEIEQLTIAIGLGPRESEPEISAVVRLHEAQQRSVLIRQRFKGQRDPEFTEDVYVGEKTCWLLVDDKTFAVGPALLAADLVAGLSYAADPSDDLRSMIPETDSDRHVTVMVDTSALAIHTSALFDPSLQQAMVHFTDWLGEDVDGVSASLHFGDKLFMETLLRNGTGSTAAKLNRHIRSRVEELPGDILSMVKYMRPRRKGPRQIIARFPAMTKAFSAATDTGIADRMVQLTTVLPERAIPNLAVATILTWDESTRTDFDRERAPATTTQTKKLPETLAGRLKMVIEVEFKRTPLQEAFALLGDEIGVNFRLDGDGLKLAGYTQNMAQTHNLGTVAAAEGVKAILKQYEKMVLVADEASKTVTVTTVDALEASGAKAYTLP